jgi:hypothetical protein
LSLFGRGCKEAPKEVSGDGSSGSDGSGDDSKPSPKPASNENGWTVPDQLFHLLFMSAIAINATRSDGKDPTLLHLVLKDVDVDLVDVDLARW